MSNALSNLTSRQNFIYSLRSLLRRPGFSLAAILTIALGVGANIAVSGVLYNVLQKPLPYAHPKQLVQLWETDKAGRRVQAAYPDYRDWVNDTKSFQSIAAYTFEAMNKVPLLGEGEPEQIQATMISHNLFPTMGISITLGRNFDATDDEQSNRVILMSESLWRRKFQSDPHVVGRLIHLGPAAFTVIGIVPDNQRFPVWADIWLPMSLLEPMLRESRRFHPLETIARLKEATSPSQAQGELMSISTNLAQSYPATNSGEGVEVIGLLDGMTQPVRPALIIAMLIASLVFLICCANVAHLVLARTMGRGRELGIRASVGAGPGDLIQLFIIENLAIVCCGALAGLTIAGVLLWLFRRFAVKIVPRAAEVRLDPVVWLYTVIALGIVIVLISLPSYIRLRRADLTRLVAQGDAYIFSQRRGHLAFALISSELAMAFVAFAIAILLVHSFSRLLDVQAGFDGTNVADVDVVLSGAIHGWDDAAQLFDTRIAPMLRDVPGVTAVAEANVAPMTLDQSQVSRFTTRFAIPGVTPLHESTDTAQVRWISQDYFRVLNIPILSGEPLAQADRNRPKCLINHLLAHRFFRGQDPVGRKLVLDADTSQPREVAIAGVVGDVKDLSLDADVQPTVYWIDTSPVLALLVRSNANPAGMNQKIRDVVHQANSSVTVSNFRIVSESVHKSVQRYRVALWLMVGFALIAGILSAIGIYGVVAFAVGTRVREFAIRLALGATPLDVASMVIREAFLASVVGILFGIGLSWFASQSIRSIVFRVSQLDPLALIGAGLISIAICAVAAMVPSFRASAVSPTLTFKEL